MSDAEEYMTEITKCTDLMKAWGSEDGQWRPEPMKHAIARKNRGKTILERTVASVLVASTRPRPSHWSAHAITEKGTVWGAKDLQKEQRWKSLKTAETALLEAEREGWIRREVPAPKTGRGTTRSAAKIYLVATVDTKRVTVDDGVCTDAQSSLILRQFFSVAELAEIEAFEPERKRRAEQVAELGCAYIRNLLSEGAQQLRWWAAHEQYNAKLALGLHPAENGRPRPETHLLKELKLASFMESVQVPSDGASDGARTDSNKEDVHAPETPPHPIKQLENCLEELASYPETPEKPTQNPEEELRTHMLAIAQESKRPWPPITRQTLQNFLRVAESAKPGCTVQEIGAAVALIVRDNVRAKTWGLIHDLLRPTLVEHAQRERSLEIEAARRREDEECARRELVATARATLADPMAGERERRTARETLELFGQVTKGAT